MSTQTKRGKVSGHSMNGPCVQDQMATLGYSSGNLQSKKDLLVHLKKNSPELFATEKRSVLKRREMKTDE